MYSQFFNPFGFWQNAMTHYSNQVTKVAVDAADKAVKQNVASGQKYMEVASKHVGALMAARAPEEFFKAQTAWFEEVFNQMQSDTQASLALFQETSESLSKVAKSAFNPAGE